MVRACIEGSRCKIKFGNNYSKELKMTVELKQGDALSPTLFQISLEDIVRKVQETANGFRFKGKAHTLMMKCTWIT